jgi:Mor family transcriptional regulator
MLVESILTGISVSDIQSEHMQEIALQCGLDDALALMSKMPGLEIYIPASAKKGYDWEYVHEHFDGYNAATIAGCLGMNREDVIRISKQPAPISARASNDHLNRITEKCGPETAQRLAETFPGYKFYIPINGLSIAIRKYIERSFNGSNTQELALACGVSERHVRQVIAEKYQSSAQLSLFD